MKCKKETDYRTVDPQAVYELKKVALRLRRKGKEVKEICEITGLADKTVRMTFEAYDAGGINAIKPKKRGRKAGEKRTLSAEQEQEIITLLVDHDPAQFKLKGCMWTRVSTPVRFCSFSPKGECRKMAVKGVQPWNNYTRRFRPSSLKCTDKSGLDGLQADK